MTMTLLTIAATITTYTLILSITINVALYKQIEENNREIWNKRFKGKIRDDIQERINKMLDDNAE